MRRANDDAMQRVGRDEIGDIAPAPPHEAIVFNAVEAAAQERLGHVSCMERGHAKGNRVTAHPDLRRGLTAASGGHTFLSTTYWMSSGFTGLPRSSTSATCSLSPFARDCRPKCGSPSASQRS